MVNLILSLLNRISIQLNLLVHPKNIGMAIFNPKISQLNLKATRRNIQTSSIIFVPILFLLIIIFVSIITPIFIPCPIIVVVPLIALTLITLIVEPNILIKPLDISPKTHHLTIQVVYFFIRIRIIMSWYFSLGTHYI